MDTHAGPSLRASGRDVRDGLIGLVATGVALLVAAWVLDGLSLSPWWTAFVVAAVMAVVDLLVRPALRALVRRAGAVTALLLGVVVQVAVVELALLAVPSAAVASLGATVATLVVVAVVSVVTRWLLGATDNTYLVANLIRRGERRRRRTPRTGADPGASPVGVVVVQVDGLPFPLLQHGIVSGVLPTLARWVRSGGHDAVRWWAQVPSTTPASQAALLHGTSDGIPAFRWYEKDTGRLLVANRPADAAVVEERLSDGRGLLADGGVSVSNIFSGDAPTAFMTMSRITGRGGLGPGRGYVGFFASPFVFPQALVRTVGEMVKELHQRRRQRLRGIEPRVRRRGAYVALRGLTNVLLRDLNVALVAEHMIAGVSVVFVDLVDYDEIAHHAGVARPEALAALAGVDGVLGTLEKVAAAAPREYRFVVLSDHGQSQGPTFRQLTGRGLEEAVREHTDAAGAATLVDTGDVEVWGPLNAMLAEVLSAVRPGAGRADGPPGSGGTGVVVGPQRGTPDTASGERPELVVVGSGNLGLVWFPGLPGRVPIEDLDRRFPALVPGLLSEPGVAFVVVDSARGPLVVGPDGVRVLLEGVVEGRDPLAGFGPRAAADLARVAVMGSCPDLYVHSTVDPRTDEVHAFEELVGCHGGLGGWQNDAVLVHPADWPLDADLLDRTVEGEALLYGADAVHRQLVRWLERCGARRAVPATPLHHP
ncbi:alkaline phosphatase family protein [Pseudonocardia sp. RS11V-5]|uniref:alkaline phosphatase family protein n=1 Tax=Pseudonocardia terrae TaxID=2905831 RepID=UPI001E5C91CA|nr:alkaline phosphatase family protein [Pseudonocardia terrae]MCE3554199.1 alkaline phosphatase family protein [Pseudonocardia terrae]